MLLGAVCRLLNNLALCFEKYSKDAFTFLDILNEEYILLTTGIPFLGRARKAAMEKRDIGLGTLGFHELLQIKGFAFETADDIDIDLKKNARNNLLKGMASGNFSLYFHTFRRKEKGFVYRKRINV